MLNAMRRGAAAAAIGAALLALGCTNAAVDQAVGTSDGAPEIVVSRSDSTIKVENQVGRPVLNVRVEVVGDATFVHVLPALDAGATRELTFAEFRTEDGVLFDPATGSPRQITLTARDSLGGSHEATVEW